ncbi:Cleft lip and palate transmembrane protein 1 protein [Fasciola gigantica]|uniref:Lipid scramblase CLPTM1L n=1 Tax=Fasciola gigantica TaxID=46835 RepID=A0A504YTT5_FASGI|nr:Cleft lip and palate transmembrane protein 1 protein [Fasciola gigantica]
MIFFRACISLTGLRPKDIDEVRSLLVDTNFYFLLTTIFVSVFHLLFDFLAFKNDIAFWRKTNNTAGLSTRTVVWRFVSSLIIFLHLWEERSSMLVVVPMGISTCIELWKLCRITKLTVSLHHGLQWGTRSQEEQATDQLDAQFMYWLVCLMVPLCLAGSVYSLLYLPHRSWYSWCLQTLVNEQPLTRLRFTGLFVLPCHALFHCFSSGVYAFGFLLMTPQLFLNYRLKSVAHLPWKALTYKAFNTFIDDFFAFIITMPTAHRIACLRDDIVFVIYLYQRWLYPVDKSRTNEFGQRGNDEGQDQQQSDSSQNKSKTAKKNQPQNIKTSGGKEVGRSEKIEKKDSFKREKFSTRIKESIELKALSLEKSIGD